MAPKKQDTSTQPKSTGDSRLDYLHKVGLTDMTLDDLQVPDVGSLTHRTEHPMEFMGEDVHPEFEYYRAVYQQTIDQCRAKGYVALPKGTDVRMRGASTESEVVMARLRTVGDVHRRAEYEQRQARRRGEMTSTSKLHGSDTHISQRVTRSVGPSPVQSQEM